MDGCTGMRGIRRRSGGGGEGKGQGDGGALVKAGTVGGDIASVLANDVADEEEAEAGAFDSDGVAAGNAVEAVEDAFVLVGRQAEAGVGNAKGSPGVVGDGEGAADVNTIGGVFDGVIEEVEDGGAEVFGDALNVETDGAGDGLDDDGFRGEMVALEGDINAVSDECGEIYESAVLLAVTLT